MEKKKTESLKPLKKKRILQKVGIGIIVLIFVFVAGFYIYTLDYYRASEDVAELISMESERIIIEKGRTVIYPEESNNLNKGLIFYPGGKVEAIAYLPLLKQLSDIGLTCILVEMPMNLAVFDVDAADKIYDDFPNLDQWYIAGHSLGGAMASSYMEKNSEKVDGLILLGAYPINDADVPTLVIYGSEDVMLDLTKLETTELKYEIKGGNHAQFGNYGEQAGDGTAVISREEEQKIAVGYIQEFIK